MKEVVNIKGKRQMVSLDTPVKTVDGVHYLHTKSDKGEIREYEDVYTAQAADRKLQEVIKNRNEERGSVERQLEYLIDHGLEALQERDRLIKEKYKKGG